MDISKVAKQLFGRRTEAVGNRKPTPIQILATRQRFTNRSYTTSRIEIQKRTINAVRKMVGRAGGRRLKHLKGPDNVVTDTQVAANTIDRLPTLEPLQWIPDALKGAYWPL